MPWIQRHLFSFSRRDQLIKPNSLAPCVSMAACISSSSTCNRAASHMLCSCAEETRPANCCRSSSISSYFASIQTLVSDTTLFRFEGVGGRPSARSVLHCSCQWATRCFCCRNEFQIIRGIRATSVLWQTAALLVVVFTKANAGISRWYSETKSAMVVMVCAKALWNRRTCTQTNTHRGSAMLRIFALMRVGKQPPSP